jgi:molybdate transport system substrate-binding protein
MSVKLAFATFLFVSGSTIMIGWRLIRVAILWFVFASDLPARTEAAELRVLSTHAFLEVLKDLTPTFEKESGYKITFGLDPSGIIKQQIEAGGAFDVAIVTSSVLDDLSKQGRIESETKTVLASSGLGLVVRKGAPKPDISTPEGFKQVLLGARSIIRSTEGTSGIYFANLMERLGIAEAIRAKTTLGPSGRVAEFVARGEIEIGVQQIPELLPVEGTIFLGPFPEELQLHTVFSAGVSVHSQNQDAAKKFIETLTAPSSRAILKARGLEPMFPVGP